MLENNHMYFFKNDGQIIITIQHSVIGHDATEQILRELVDYYRRRGAIINLKHKLVVPDPEKRRIKNVLYRTVEIIDGENVIHIYLI